MAKYRPVHTRIWKDPDFENFNSSMKLIFLYLCTNELTTESGIYSISLKTISKETGVPEKTVRKLLENGFKNLKYDFTNNCVFIKNFLKYNGGGSPELIKKSIRKNYEEFETPLWNEFIEKYPEYSNGLQTVDKQFDNCSLDIDIEIENRNRSNKGVVKGEKPEEEKIKYADFVSMTKEEHQKLIEKYGEDNTKKFIEKLNIWKGANGKTKAKGSDYLKILNWVVEAVLNKGGGSSVNTGGNTKRFENERDYGEEEHRKIAENFYA